VEILCGLTASTIEEEAERLFGVVQLHKNGEVGDRLGWTAGAG
jgi:hypothetical protein